MNPSKLRALTVLGVVAAAVPAIAQTAQKKAVQSFKSTQADREDVAITVYNQNFGLVREVRNITVGQGRSELEFGDVAEQIQPATVNIKSLTSATGLRVLEQNYRYDLLSPAKLLEKYVGKRIKVYRWNEKTGKDDAYDADVLSVSNGTVLKINGEITYDFPGRFAFPEVPQNLIAKPTLVWMLDSQAPKQKIEVTYLTQNLNWSADYVFVINDADTQGDLTGWVTLTNQTGTSYENAKLKLVAGDVQRVTPPQENYGYAKSAAYAPSASAAPQFKEEGFFEYHLYTLERPTNLLQNEQKQVVLLDAKNIGVNKKLIFFGAQYYYRGSYGQVMSNQKVGVYLDIENKEANHLGMPLPKGTVRVYKADKSGSKQFIGEDSIDHTPRDEKLRIKMGEAFDVVGDRKETEWKTLGSCGGESAWEITLKNHKDTATSVEDYEPIGGDWEILSSSIPSTKKDANT
ncbi:MAG: DUF4139 domain-containing protein, partial [Polyangiaceae bacterium]